MSRGHSFDPALDYDRYLKRSSQRARRRQSPHAAGDCSTYTRDQRVDAERVRRAAPRAHGRLGRLRAPPSKRARGRDERHPRKDPHAARKDPHAARRPPHARRAPREPPPTGVGSPPATRGRAARSPASTTPRLAAYRRSDAQARDPLVTKGEGTGPFSRHACAPRAFASASSHNRPPGRRHHTGGSDNRFGCGPLADFSPYAARRIRTEEGAMVGRRRFAYDRCTSLSNVSR